MMPRKTVAAETRPSARSAGPAPVDNYRDLLARVDHLCRTITGEFAAQLACRPGCAGCCRHISLFPVEAVALAAALGRLPVEQAAAIRARAGRALPDGPCPLLGDGLCLLYETRPIICRTHGLPLLTALEGKRSIDFCPLNFRGLDSLPGSAVIDLDRLNTTLAAINALFVTEFFGDAPPEQERLSIAEALLIEP
ncbi:MAG: YkgJ family cysteine cluster protein [Geobacteraceae bacterium]|nr:YkgJ family cysteine cluster protein [Geobacteraceae bacterium]